MLRLSTVCPSRKQLQAMRNCPWSEESFLTCSPSAWYSVGTWPCIGSETVWKRCFLICRAKRSMRSLPWCDQCWNSAGIMWVALDLFSYPSIQSSMKVTDNLRVLDEPSKKKLCFLFLLLAFMSWKSVLLVCALSDLHPPQQCVWTAV